MKKAFGILLLLLIFPNIISAACDYTKHTKYSEVAGNITYETSYLKESSTFNITIYNLVDDMYVKYNSRQYSHDTSNKTLLTKIKEGSRVVVEVYVKDSCDTPVRTIYINLPYYNKYYGSGKCLDYEDKITLCSQQFMSYEVTETILEQAKYNYDNEIIQEVKEVEPVVEEITMKEKIISFAYNWGAKILLAVLTTYVTNSVYKVKYRKIKHGI